MSARDQIVSYLEGNRETFIAAACDIWDHPELAFHEDYACARLAGLLESGTLFVSDAKCGWLCLNCGHIHMGPMAPAVCPICHQEQGYFVRLSMMPVTLQSL